MNRALNTDEFYDILTAAMVEARSVGDDESADEIDAALEVLNGFAIGFICTALHEFEPLR